MKIGDEVYIHGYVGEIRENTIIISNDGGYFGSVPSEIVTSVKPECEKGEWIPVHPLQSNDNGAYMCSKCKTGMWEIKPSIYHYCPNCGADMRTKETDCDYERAVEQLEHDMLYEPTFNQDDGSM